MAPIDPVQLLNALASLLSPDGGIKSIEEVTRLSSLMKKFSKKLVSRCVYCNVLRATKPEILQVFLDENGWNTINAWLQDARNSNNNAFLYELLQLCKVLPMTVERMKQNNTARLVKSLTKFEDAGVKELSLELVQKWMTILKLKTSATSDGGSEKKKKKKQKEKKKEPPVEKVQIAKVHKEEKRIEKNLKVVLEKDLKVAAERSLRESAKEPAKLKGLKRNSKDKEIQEIYEDVKIDPEPLVKKLKTAVDRPKTVKLFNKKFRATGLEEETPLPKPVNKKTVAVNKPIPAPAVKTGVKRGLHSSLSDQRINEKKIKPDSLINSVENSNQNGGIKLIPPKPKPVHILHESASFMDALVAQPTTLPKKKKKVPVNKPSTPPTPPSPTITPPKLQFYKDTLEMDENNEEAADKSTDDSSSKEVASASSPPREIKEEPVEATSEKDKNPSTPVDPSTSGIELNSDSEIAKDASKVKNEELMRNSELGPVQLRSILTHGKRPEKKKTVRWLEENLKEVFYFDMDETERVNVNHMHHNFGDLKSLEMKREREAFEAARRHLGDRMEEMIQWWVEPIIVDAPPPLVDPGCNSREKEIQLMKQQSTLQEIYFTREMVPDSPHEPEPEVVAPQEPKVIPLDDEFHLGAIMDYSTLEMPEPKAALPDVLTSLMNIPNRKMPPQQQTLYIPEQPPVENNRIPQPHPSMSIAAPYDPADPLPTSMGLLGVAPPSHMFASPPGPEMENGPLPEWRPMEPVGMIPPDQYFGTYPSNRPLLIDHMHQSIHSRGDIRPRMNGPIMVPEMYPTNMRKGPSLPPRPPGGSSRRPRIPCKHFMAGGCRYGVSCNFLHPGINGPST